MAENFNRLSRAGARTLQTTDRRQTDGRNVCNKHGADVRRNCHPVFANSAEMALTTSRFRFVLSSVLCGRSSWLPASVLSLPLFMSILYRTPAC